MLNALTTSTIAHFDSIIYEHDPKVYSPNKINNKSGMAFHPPRPKLIARFNLVHEQIAKGFFLGLLSSYRVVTEAN